MGYGWTNPDSGNRNSKPINSGNALTSNAVYATDMAFQVDLPNGAYKVTETVGDLGSSAHGAFIFVQGTQVDQVLTAANHVATTTYMAIVTDGHLVLEWKASPGYDNYAVVEGFSITPLTFNFGPGNQLAPVNHTVINERSDYDPSLGYGWASWPDSYNRNNLTRPGGTAWTSKAVYATDMAFQVDLPNGTYDVTETVGDIWNSPHGAYIFVQGTQVDQVVTAANHVATTTYLATVTDGHLVLEWKASPGYDNYAVVEGFSIAKNSVFVKTDQATQGNWHGTAYGIDGSYIANFNPAPPAYAIVSDTETSSGNGTGPGTWSASTTDGRALQKPAPATDHIASAWFGSTITFDVNLVDGQAHQVALYALDGDRAARAESVVVRDAVTGAVLDVEAISSFVDGVWLAWNLRGHVTIQVTSTNPASNAAVSGLLFSPVYTSVRTLPTDTSTQGNWHGTAYGIDGSYIANFNPAPPAYAIVSDTETSSGNGTGPGTWSASTTDGRALQKPAPATDHIASAWFGSTITFDVNLVDGQAHQVALYALDGDRAARSESVVVRDAVTGAVLDIEAISSFAEGVWLAWNLRGHVTIQVTSTNPASNAAASGLFFSPVYKTAQPVAGGGGGTGTAGVAIPGAGSGIIAGHPTHFVGSPLAIQPSDLVTTALAELYPPSPLPIGGRGNTTQDRLGRIDGFARDILPDSGRKRVSLRPVASESLLKSWASGVLGN